MTSERSPIPLERALQRVLQRCLHELQDSDGPESLPEWDSHAHLELLTQLEEGYRIRFTLDEQLELATLGAIRSALEARGVL